MSNILKVFELFSKQDILEYARNGGCEYVRLNLETKKPDKRARNVDKVRKGAEEHHLFMQVDYKRKVFSLSSK